MVRYGVLFEVRTESLNIIQTSFGFKGFKLAEQNINGIRCVRCLSKNKTTPHKHVSMQKVPKLWGATRGYAFSSREWGRASCLYEGHILNETWAQDKIHILVGTLHG
jgi:hypothetical protein